MMELPCSLDNGIFEISTVTKKVKNSLNSVRSRTNVWNTNTVDKFRVVAVVFVVVVAVAFGFERVQETIAFKDILDVK